MHIGSFFVRTSFMHLVMAIMIKGLFIPEPNIEENCRDDAYLDSFDVFHNKYGDSHSNRLEPVQNSTVGSIWKYFLNDVGRFDLLNPEIGEEGETFLEGDMVVDEYEFGVMDEVLMLEDLQRKFKPGTKYLWPTDPESGFPTVHFTIEPLVERDRDIILSAIQMWEETTCVVFIEMDEKRPQNISHVLFARRKGCWSNIGRKYSNRPQLVSVDGGCLKAGVIAHEIGHVLGMLHEHSRSDRDDHVIVLWDNIRPMKSKNFKLLGTKNSNIPYDLSSIMHYGGSYFSKSEGVPTLISKNPYHQWHMGQREKVTFRDALSVNKIYGCLEKWALLCHNETNVCENAGYFNQNCSCICPPGTEGEYCQNVTSDYLPELDCGGNVTSQQNISTPNFPNYFPSKTLCMWWIQAEKCERVKLTFHVFNLLFRKDGKCLLDKVEIRIDDPVMPGRVYCGCEIKGGQVFFSKDNSLFLSFYGSQEYAVGFSATVEFVENKSCSDFNEI